MRFPGKSASLVTPVLGTRSRSARVIARSLIDLGRCHLPRDVSHLLADVVASRAGCEGLELGFDVDGGLSLEPGRTELGVGRAVAGRAGRNITHGRTAGNDLRNSYGVVGMGSRLARQIRIVGGEIEHVLFV